MVGFSQRSRAVVILSHWETPTLASAPKSQILPKTSICMAKVLICQELRWEHVVFHICYVVIHNDDSDVSNLFSYDS